MLRSRVKVQEGRVIIPVLPWWSHWLDWLLQPVMYWLQADWRSLPQETHVWNNARFPEKSVRWLSVKQIVTVASDPTATEAYWWQMLPIFHMPRFGGWQRFVVLQPKVAGFSSWYIGWVTPEFAGISLLPLRGPVRLLRGPSTVTFFAVGADGQQIDLQQVGEGRLGSIYYQDVPLR